MSCSGLNAFFIPTRPSERLACLTILVHQGDDQQEEGEGVLPNSNLFSQQNSWRLFTLLTTKRCPFDEPLSDVHLYESIPPGRNCWETKDCLFLHLPHTVAEDRHSLEPENRVENVQILFPVSEFWDQSLVAKLFIYQYLSYMIYMIFLVKLFHAIRFLLDSSPIIAWPCSPTDQLKLTLLFDTRLD